MSRRSFILSWVVAGAFIVLAIVMVYRQSNAPGPELPTRDDAGAISTSAKASIEFAKASDCIASLPQDSEANVDQVTFVPCTQPHQVLVLGLTEISSVGSSQYSQQAATECIQFAIDATGHDPNDADAGYKLTIVPPGGSLNSYLCLADYYPGDAPS